MLFYPHLSNRRMAVSDSKDREKKRVEKESGIANFTGFFRPRLLPFLKISAGVIRAQNLGGGGRPDRARGIPPIRP
jgi:hypothetical protein